MATRAKAARQAGLIVLDSSCWIEYLRDSSRADLFAAAVEAPEHLIVPVITIYEVTKKLRRELNAATAAYAESVMCLGQVIAFDPELSRKASTLDLPLADSVIYATAQAHLATLWTQDARFQGLEGVKFFEID